MRKNIKIIVFLLLFSCFFLGQLNFSFARDKALEVQYPEIQGERPATIKTGLAEYTKYIFNFAIRIVGLIAFAVLVYGGIQYLTSAGNPAKIDDAKDQISSAFLGLIILFSSHLILNTINAQIISSEIKPLGKIEVPEGESPPPVEKKQKTFTFFQIPTGKLIQNAILEDEAEIMFEQAIATTKEIEDQSKELKDLTQELKSLTDACKCGHTSCSPKGCYGGPPDCPDPPECILQKECGLKECEVEGCPGAFCDTEKIEKTIKEIKLAIEKLKEIEQGLDDPNSFLVYNLSGIKRASILMSVLYEEIEDYNTMLIDRHFLEQDEGIKVEFAYFPDWHDALLRSSDESIIIQDPATFYFNKENNEDAIQMAESFYAAPPGYAVPVGPITPGVCPNPGEQLKGIEGYKALLSYAKKAEEKTGVRAGLILAVLKVETRFGSYLGSLFTDDICTAPPPRCGTPEKKETICQSFKNTICPPLKLDPYQSYVSGKILKYNHCGGAMGPAQFMPYTWLDFESRIRKLTNHYPPSPYDLEDAVMAAALHLKYRGGADQKTCAAEREAARRYVGGQSWYADCVLIVANKISELEGLEQCKE